jgi:2-alkenal reductase
MFEPELFRKLMLTFCIFLLSTSCSQYPSLPEVYEFNVAGVVTITSELEENNQRSSAGSGFIWDNDGHIVTNSHVVRDAKNITVKFSDGVEMEAELIAHDVYSDLAVLSITYPDGYKITLLNLGDSKKVKVGQDIIAIGNPFGESFTLTKGIVSAIGRARPDLITNFQIGSVIQHDASINPGNSGGPLMDIEGNVIGINAQIASSSGGSTGIGFAIPINTAKKVIPALLTNKIYEHPYLGIAGTGVNLEIIKNLGLPRMTQGILVTFVDAEGPSGYSSLTAGDIITSIEKYPIKSFSGLVNFLTENTISGDLITLTVFRDNENLDIQVTLGARPSSE